MGDIQPSDLYVHNESGRQVLVVCTGKMLTDSHWVHSVTYRTIDNDQNWTRTRESFEEKFTFVNSAF